MASNKEVPWKFYNHIFGGWIGFVAFMDYGTAIRCFMEKRSFFGPHSYSDVITYQYNNQEDPTLPRILGYYSILKALALTHCTLFIHYKPVVSLGICSLLLAIFMYLTEALYHHSAKLSFYIVFPCVLNALTLIGLLILPKKLLEPQIVNEDENVELLRQAQAIRKKRLLPPIFWSFVGSITYRRYCSKNPAFLEGSINLVLK